MRVVVNERTQVSHEGRVYGASEELNVADSLAQSWLDAGWVKEVTDLKRDSKKRSARNK